MMQNSRYGASVPRDYQQPSTSGAYYTQRSQQPSTSMQYFYRSPLTHVVFQCSECQKKFETREELYVHCEECLVEMFENEAMNALSDMNSPPQRAIPANSYRPIPQVPAGIVAKSTTPLASPLLHPRAKPAEINGITVTPTPISLARTYSNQQTALVQPIYYEENEFVETYDDYPNEEAFVEDCVEYENEEPQNGTDHEIASQSTPFITTSGNSYFVTVESGGGPTSEGIDLTELDEDVLLEGSADQSPEELEDDQDLQEMPQLEQITAMEEQDEDVMEEMYEYVDESQYEDQGAYEQLEEIPPPSQTLRYEEMQKTTQQPSTSSYGSYNRPQPQSNVYRMAKQYPRYCINDVPQTRTTSEEGKPKMECPTCGLILYRHNFSTHYRIHTGEMPFNCHYCQKRFRTTSSLKVHIRAHTGEKPYQCPRCPYACITKRNLDRHIQNNHEKNNGESGEGGPRYRRSRYRDREYGSASTGIVWKPQSQFQNQNPFSEDFGRPIPVAVPVNSPQHQQTYIPQEMHQQPKVIMPRNSRQTQGQW